MIVLVYERLLVSFVIFPSRYSHISSYVTYLYISLLSLLVFNSTCLNGTIYLLCCNLFYSAHLLFKILQWFRTKDLLKVRLENVEIKKIHLLIGYVMKYFDNEEQKEFKTN